MKQFVSHSEISSWIYDKDAYVRKYIDGIEEPPNERMILGKLIHEAIAEPAYSLVENLKKEGFSQKQQVIACKLVDKVKKPKFPEVRMTIEHKDVKFIAFLDGLDPTEGLLEEHKTTDNMKDGKRVEKWWQPRVDADKQLSMYDWMYGLYHHKFLREIRLNRLDTTTGTVKTFYTIRSRADRKMIEEYIFGVINEWKKEGLWLKRLSRKEAEDKKIKKLI